MNNLAEIRTEKGMTQTELADACGVTQKTISALEVNRRKPSYELLIRLTKALNVTADKLIGDADSKEELEAELDRKVAAGEISADEAEHEYRDFVDPEPRYSGREW